MSTTTQVTQRFSPKFISTSQDLLDKKVLRNELVKTRRYAEELVANLQVVNVETSSTVESNDNTVLLNQLRSSANALATTLSDLTLRVDALENRTISSFIFDSSLLDFTAINLIQVGAAFGALDLEGELTLNGDFYIYG